MAIEKLNANQLFEKYSSLTRNWSDSSKTNLCKRILDYDPLAQSFFEKNPSHFYTACPHFGYVLHGNQIQAAPLIYKPQFSELSKEWKSIYDKYKDKFYTQNFDGDRIPDSFEKTLGIYKLPFIIIGVRASQDLEEAISLFGLEVNDKGDETDKKKASIIA